MNNMNKNKNKNKNVLPAQQENESQEQREHQEDAKINNNVPSYNLDALNNDNYKAWSAAVNGWVSNLEWLNKEVADTIIEANTIIVPKDCCGDFRSHKYLRNLDAATSPLDPKMGVSSHFDFRHNGETETGSKSKYLYIG